MLGRLILRTDPPPCALPSRLASPIGACTYRVRSQMQIPTIVYSIRYRDGIPTTVYSIRHRDGIPRQYYVVYGTGMGSPDVE